MSTPTTAPSAPTTRISFARLGIVLLGTTLVAGIGVRSISAAVTQPSDPGATVFAPYVDVTVTPMYPFETPAGPADSNVTLAFVVSGQGAACSPRWGGAYTLDAAASDLQLDRRLSQLRLTGGSAVVSFGGQAGTELATSCTDLPALTAAYRSVVDRYELDTIDLDLEGATLSDTAALARRAQAVRDLQQARKDSGDPLAVWLTLPVGPSGLTAEGLAAVTAMLCAGVDLAGVNGMTMDFEVVTSLDDPQSTLVLKSAAALQAQVRSAFAAAGQPLDDAGAWGHVGLTPMVGQNDVRTERFTIADAAVVNEFVRTNGVGRLSMWSLNRDVTCGPPLPSVLVVVQTDCSGVEQGSQSFADVLGNQTDSWSGSASTAVPTPSATPTASASPSPSASATDDPATSPFPIWDPSGTYPAGTQVVWHHQVFTARYWTTNFPPDTPTATARDNPWDLIGPVLPGDTPAPLPTLPAGTYPQWDGATAYAEGARVQVGNVPYVAKWWSQGQVPGDQVPGGSPWLLVIPGA